MKKKVFWLAAMAVTVSMASCSLEEVVEQPTPQAIGFSSFVGKPTKAVNETKIGDLYAGFQVYGAYKADANVFGGVTVSSDNSGTSWSYDDTQYWVPGQSYKFAAMGPTGALTGKGTLSFDYTTGLLTLKDYTEANLENSKDIVYAGNVTRTTHNPLQASDYDAVSFTFDHIMSWIKIKFVHKMTSGYKITVSDVNVVNVKTKATYTASSATPWSAPTESATFTTPGQTPHSYKTSGNADDSTSPLNENGDYGIVDFIAIPQTIAATGAPFTVTFKLGVTDNEGTSLVTDKSVTATMTSDQTWASNYVYVYTAELDETVLDLQPIKFTVQSVTPWNATEQTDDFDTVQ